MKKKICLLLFCFICFVGVFSQSIGDFYGKSVNDLSAVSSGNGFIGVQYEFLTYDALIGTVNFSVFESVGHGVEMSVGAKIKKPSNIFLFADFLNFNWGARLGKKVELNWGIGFPLVVGIMETMFGFNPQAEVGFSFFPFFEAPAGFSIFTRAGYNWSFGEGKDVVGNGFTLCVGLACKIPAMDILGIIGDMDL